VTQQTAFHGKGAIPHIAVWTDDRRCLVFGAKEGNFMSEENKKPEAKIEAGELSLSELDNVAGGSDAAGAAGAVGPRAPQPSKVRMEYREHDRV
jgi:hypothetical protein